jgi:hypothetical protein
MVLYRNSLLMGLYTLTLAVMMLAAPLPLYRIDVAITTNATTTRQGAATHSFFEKCPINESDDGRVVAGQCRIFTPDEAGCEGESGLSTLGKIATVSACVFTGACVVLHFLSENVAMCGYDTIVLVNAGLSTFFAHFWWILSAANYSTALCGRDAASEMPGGKIGANFGIAFLASWLSTAALVVVIKKELLADKSF